MRAGGRRSAFTYPDDTGEMATDWDAAVYGDRIADVYDDWYGNEPEVGAAVETVAALAAGGDVLELGIGTGRLALPLVERGLRVHGVDASAAMVARLRAKPGGEHIPVVIGDMADVPVADAGVGIDGAGDRRFALVLVAFNTFFNLPSRDAQRRCFSRVADRLAPGGAFVVEAFVPDAERLIADPGVTVRRIEPERVTLVASKVDTGRQMIELSFIDITEAGIRLYPLQARYAAPEELDAMAADAGLALAERWADWQRAAFTADSPSHVSVYRAVQHV